MVFVFLVQLIKGMVVLVIEIRSLGGEDDMLGFEYVVFEMFLRYLSVQQEVGYTGLGYKRYSYLYIDDN